MRGVREPHARRSSRPQSGGTSRRSSASLRVRSGTRAVGSEAPRRLPGSGLSAIPWCLAITDGVTGVSHNMHASKIMHNLLEYAFLYDIKTANGGKRPMRFIAYRRNGTR